MPLNQKVSANSRLAATIASGAAVSDALKIITQGPRGLAVLTPAAWTAANIGFEVSQDGDTWYPLYDKTGTRVQITGIATSEARLYVAPPEVWAVGVWPWLRLCSLNTSTGAALNQGAARALIAVLMT